MSPLCHITLRHFTLFCHLSVIYLCFTSHYLVTFLSHNFVLPHTIMPSLFRLTLRHVVLLLLLCHLTLRHSPLFCTSPDFAVMSIWPIFSSLNLQSDRVMFDTNANVIHRSHHTKCYLYIDQFHSLIVEHKICYCSNIPLKTLCHKSQCHRISGAHQLLSLLNWRIPEGFVM